MKKGNLKIDNQVNLKDLYGDHCGGIIIDILEKSLVNQIPQIDNFNINKISIIGIILPVVRTHKDLHGLLPNKNSLPNYLKFFAKLHLKEDNNKIPCVLEIFKILKIPQIKISTLQTLIDWKKLI